MELPWLLARLRDSSYVDLIPLIQLNTDPYRTVGFLQTLRLLVLYFTLIMFSNTIVGNIAFMEKAVHEGREFLAITLYVKDQYDGICRVKFNNANGLLTAHNNGTLVVGQQLILSQYDVRINSIRTHYEKDGKLVSLKYPEVALTRVRATIGAAPEAKPVAPAAKAEPTLEEVLF
jgi:hypothetical protein